ncbi:zinc transporter protein [Coccidioides immitis H538.4]|uniref:Zinc transporter protein n=1 Tax=Coccidioides immitis H538.4 TaxID=396776 RepID=A0A0J8S553_COCIT|nr:zinc transporter protein [Coccidioides immitis H538.4]
MLQETGPRISSLADVPISLLKAELERRSLDIRAQGISPGPAQPSTRPACGSTTRAGSYNTPIHVFALFLILILSTLACSFPIIARRFPRLPIPRRFLFLSRHFGTGVLIATAFVHLLPTAFISLTNPCLPHFWNRGYPETAGLVAMIAVMIVVTIEMFFAMRGAGHVHGSEYDTLMDEVSHHNHYEGLGVGRDDTRGSGTQHGTRQMSLGFRPVPTASRDSLIDGASPTLAKDPENQRQGDDENLQLEELDPFPDDSSEFNDSPTSEAHPSHPRPPPHHSHGHVHFSGSRSQKAQKQLIQCLLLEAGILFHSVFIGMALSVATGANFIVLLVAISFHQTFEGFALGARIASLIPDLFPASSPKPWLMALAYGTTTPIGQAIGLGLHTLYDPASEIGLITVGMTNAFSSGLLLFAGLVELLAEDFLSDRSFETLRGRNRIEACFAVAGGAALMALVGAFA